MANSTISRRAILAATPAILAAPAAALAATPDAELVALGQALAAAAAAAESAEKWALATPAINAAYDEWLATTEAPREFDALQAIMIRNGAWALEEDADNASNRANELAERIVAIQPTTFAGLLVHFQMLRWWNGVEDTGPRDAQDIDSERFNQFGDTLARLAGAAT